MRAATIPSVRRTGLWMGVTACLIAGFAAIPAHAQTTRIRPIRPRPNLTLGDTLTITLSAPMVTFALTEGQVAAGNTPVTITTSWTGISLFSSVTLSGYFAVANQALSGGTPVAYIPSSAVFGKVSSWMSTTPMSFTQTAPLGTAGGGLTIFSQASLLSLGGSRMDTLSLQIDLSGVPQLPAAVYSGSIILQAQAF